MAGLVRPMLLLSMWMVSSLMMTREIMAATRLGAVMQQQAMLRSMRGPGQGADPTQLPNGMQQSGLGTKAVAQAQGRRMAQVPGAEFQSSPSPPRPPAGQDCAPCTEELTACAQDDPCLGYVLCNVEENCAPDDPCNSCTLPVAGNAAALALNSCMQQNGCLGERVSCDPCAPPRRSQAQMRAQVALNTLRGTYDIVYGLNPEYDCPPYQQYRFSTKPSTKPGKAFQIEYTMKLNFTPADFSTRMNFGSMDAATGAWPVKYSVVGIFQNQTNYVLDSVKDGNYWHVLLVYCGDFNFGCFSGGIVLSKKLGPGSSRAQLPASVAMRFARTLEETGWAARYDAGWDKWCKVARM